MATYNGTKYLKQQLDSILVTQSLQVDELIIVDDCSTDATVEILTQYSNNDSRVRVLLNDENYGVVRSFEMAMQNSSGDFILFSDQDDVWHKEKVRKLIDAIGGNLLMHSDAQLINSDDSIIEISFSKYKNLQLNHFVDFLIGNIVTGCTMICSRELLNFVLPFPSGVMMHDQYLAIYASFFNRLGYCNEVLTDYRQHEGNVLGGFGITYNRLKQYHQKQVIQLKQILEQGRITSWQSNLLFAIDYHDSIAYSKFPSFATLHWYFKNFGLKRTIGFLLRGAFGQSVAKIFYKVR
ncbi:MAG: glycosyltransferase family 2 protein [Burkholderiales bacterium]|nr:glycosyltransferase family 2 protein [Burkholderiales bacterium]